MADDMVLASISASGWLDDSASITHIVQQCTDFASYTPETSDIEGITPGASLRMYGCGNVVVEFKVKDKTYSVTLQDMKHAPNAPNIISIRQLTDNGHTTHFTKTGTEFTSKNGIMFGMGRKNRQMYQMWVRAKRVGSGPDFMATTKGHTLENGTGSSDTSIFG